MPRSLVGRARNLRVNVSDEELAMLHALAEADGLTVSDIVRLMTRRSYVEKFGDKKPKTKR